MVQACNVALDGQLDGFSSAAAADDIEAVRQSLGVARLSALGTGDGADGARRLGARPPARGRRLVLDGPPDPGLDEPARSEARAQATEAAFDAFAQRCTSRSACPLGADPRTTVTALVTSLRAQPLSTPDGRQLSAGTAVTAIRVALGEPSTWAALTDALQAARAGDPRRSSTGSSRPSARAAATTPRSPPTATTRRTGSRPPRSRSSPGSGRRRTRCSGAASRPTSWRARRGRPGARRALAPVPADLPPLVVIGTAAGPRSSMDAARAVAQSLPSAVFIGWQGAATGAFPRTQCVNSLVDNLLVDGQLPDASTLCPP